MALESRPHGPRKPCEKCGLDAISYIQMRPGPKIREVFWGGWDPARTWGRRLFHLRAEYQARFLSEKEGYHKSLKRFIVVRPHCPPLPSSEDRVRAFSMAAAALDMYVPPQVARLCRRPFWAFCTADCHSLDPHLRKLSGCGAGWCKLKLLPWRRRRLRMSYSFCRQALS